MTPDPFPSELVEAAAKALAEFYGDPEAWMAEDRRAATAVLSAVLPLIRSADERPRITHGRHCTCTPCRVEDWTNPALAPCGMHGKDCPREYQPWGAAGEYVGGGPDRQPPPEIETLTERATSYADLYGDAVASDMFVLLADAERAVLDAKARGRREAFREAVDALRGTGGPGWLEDDAYADWIERSFLSHPDNPEGPLGLSGNLHIKPGGLVDEAFRPAATAPDNEGSGDA